MGKKRWIIPLISIVIIIVIGIIWTVLHIGGKGEKEIKTPEDIISEHRTCTVQVTAGEYHGSGVILDISEKEVTVLTAGHLMVGYDQGIINFYNGVVGFGDVRYVSENPDLCIMTFETKYLDESELNAISECPDDISFYDELKVGDEVCLLGSAISTATNATTGTVAAKDFYVDDFDAWMLYLYSDVMAGMSGCGVYDMKGNLVGLLAGGTEDGQAVCVSLPQIYEKLEVIQNDKN